MTMKERIAAAVSAKLAPAADTETKAEIVEELSGNLYAKYQDLVAAGSDPEEAFEQAMDNLGDVSELVALAGGSRGRAEFERAMDGLESLAREVVQGLEEPVKDVVRGVKQAARAAKEPLKDMGRSIAGAVKNLEITVNVENQRQFDYTVPAQDITGLELRLRSGEVVFRLWDEETIQVIERSARALDENRHASFLRREDGVLCVEQGATAAGFVFFSFGVFASDFEVFLPRRLWRSIAVYSTSGDVTLADGLEATQLLISSTSGDVDLATGLKCGRLDLTAVSGDVDGEEVLCESLLFRGTSGDVDLDLAALPQSLDAQTVSGDLTVTLPENPGFALAYHQVSGELTTDFDLVTSVSRHEGVATYQGAQTPLYQMSTVSGDIHLAKG